MEKSEEKNMNSSYILLGIFVVLAAAIFCCIWLLLKQQKQRVEALEETVKNLESMNGELRRQRHDYINQFQVLYGMLELGESEEAYAYLKPIFKDMMKLGKALKTKVPAVNALLMAKMQVAEGKNIDMYVEVKSDIGAIAIEGWELCKVMSNILDNAIRAVEGNKGEKKIIVDINEDSRQYYIRISNNGPELTQEEQRKIFREGYSTKKEPGHGLGLSIVSEILKENKGVVEVVSSSRETCFELKFAKSLIKGGKENGNT